LAFLALLNGPNGIGGGGVGGGEAEGDEAAGIDCVKDDSGAVGEVGEILEGGGGAFAGADVLIVELETFGEINDGLATGKFGEALGNEAGGGEAAGGGDVLATAVGLLFLNAQAESEGGEGVSGVAGAEGDAVDVRQENGFIGSELLKDAEAGGGFVDGDEVTGFEAGGDEIAEGLAGVGEAVRGKAEIVDEDGDGTADVLRAEGRPATQRALEIFWRLPFWKTSKSAAVRPGRWRPFLSVTVASIWMRLTLTRMEGGSCARRAGRSRRPKRRMGAIAAV